MMMMVLWFSKSLKIAELTEMLGCWKKIECDNNYYIDVIMKCVC